MGSSILLAERNEQLAKKYSDEYRHIIASIKRGLARNQLSSIQSATSHLHRYPHQAPQVVAQLNNLVERSPISFRWFPSNHSQSSKLLIRNKTVGLLLKTAPDSAPEGIMITLDKKTPCSSLTPEFALSLLSEQARK